MESAVPLLIELGEPERAGEAGRCGRGRGEAGEGIGAAAVAVAMGIAGGFTALPRGLSGCCTGTGDGSRGGKKSMTGSAASTDGDDAPEAVLTVCNRASTSGVTRVGGVPGGVTAPGGAGGGGKPAATAPND